MRKTKIICTIGPACESQEKMEELVKAGMNVARLNFSHGGHKEQKQRIDKVRKAEEKLGKPIAVLLDTRGPEIRTGCFASGKAEVKKGQEFILYGEEKEGDERGVSITYRELFRDVQAGSRILIDDGLVELEVIRVEGKNIRCYVKNDGVISNHKGINVPDVHLSLPYVSEKDREDILFGVEEGVDFIAASFVRTAEDVKQIRKLIENAQEKYRGAQDGAADKYERIEIIAKIENEEGIQNLDEILEISDGVMVARGDMGVEIPFEEVPSIQKRIIGKARRMGKKVVTATQMLESMIKNPRPTRAEVSDVAGAVYEGTSAIMLSGETAAGNYPVEALKVMARIAERTEEDIDYRRRFSKLERPANRNITDAISHATCMTAQDLDAAAIITVTKTGLSARMISRYRPYCGVIGCSTSRKVCRQLALAWGVVPVLLEEKEKEGLPELFSSAIEAACRAELIQKEDIVVITAGVPLGISGNTNMIKVEIL